MSTPVVHREDEPAGTDVDTDKAARALYALLELSKSLSIQLDVDQLMTVISDKASAVVDAEQTRVIVWDSSPEPPPGVPGEAAKSLKLINTGSTLCAPVLDSKGKLLGVIESLNKTGGRQFDKHDESLMRALVAHVAAAMERTLLTELRVENERFEESLRVANEIQMRMLPDGEVELPAEARFAIRAHIRPARQIGGDLYDFFWNDERVYFCIGDVAGKGLGAALVMAMTKTLFRAHAAFHDDPAKVMSAASARLYEETDPSMFVTAFCGVLDLRDGRLLYSNAGHDRPLILAEGRRVRPFLSNAGLPLGVVPGFNYLTEEKTLQEREALFLYTDGVTEAANRAEELFKMDRLCQVLEACGSPAPSRVVPAVLESVDRFSEGLPQADDVTMLCIQYRGGSR
jgi:sigma-B regulation protein RsbU (phosphoserine phosphatase)